MANPLSLPLRCIGYIPKGAGVATRPQERPATPHPLGFKQL